MESLCPTSHGHRWHGRHPRSCAASSGKIFGSDDLLSPTGKICGGHDLLSSDPVAGEGPPSSSAWWWWRHSATGGGASACTAPRSRRCRQDPVTAVPREPSSLSLSVYIYISHLSPCFLHRRCGGGGVVVELISEQGAPSCGIWQPRSAPETCSFLCVGGIYDGGTAYSKRKGLLLHRAGARLPVRGGGDSGGDP